MANEIKRVGQPVVDRGIYRDPSDGLRERRDELLRQRAVEIQRQSPQVASLFARRVARQFAGRIAFFGMLCLFIFNYMLFMVQEFNFSDSAAHNLAVGALLVWAASLLSYWLVRALAPAHFRNSLGRRLALSGDLAGDVDMLATTSATDMAARIVHELERPSIAWPLAGVAMVAPLAIHFVGFVMHPDVEILDGFGFWIGMSGLLVGHCHLVLAWRGWLYARELSTTPTEKIANLNGRGIRAVATAVASSVVPGLLLLGVPCVVVAATGLVFVPISFLMARNRVIGERALLEQSVAIEPSLAGCRSGTLPLERSIAA